MEGCSYTDAVLVAVGSPIEVPNAFSPNNDAFNDTFDIYGLSQFEFSTIEIFDRWGQSVFRSVSYPNPWDGTFRGRAVPAGTYLLRHQPERTQRQPRPHHGACRRDPMKKSMYLHMVLACTLSLGWAATASAQFNGVRTQFLMTSLLDNPAAAGNSAAWTFGWGDATNGRASKAPLGPASPR